MEVVEGRSVGEDRVDVDLLDVREVGYAVIGEIQVFLWGRKGTVVRSECPKLRNSITKLCPLENIMVTINTWLTVNIES